MRAEIFLQNFSVSRTDEFINSFIVLNRETRPCSLHHKKLNEDTVYFHGEKAGRNTGTI
jgi:hypothetical protein